MERLYELGKRFERLLYSSILVAIACWSAFFLFKTLRGYEYIELADGYNSILTKLEQYKPLIREIEKNITYMKSIDDRKKTTTEIIQNNNNDNKIRKMIGLPEKKLMDEEKTEQEKLLYNYYLSKVNEARIKIGLPEVKVIDYQDEYLKESILKTLDKSNLSVSAWSEIRSEFKKEENNKNIDASIKLVRDKFDEYSKMTIKIADIEAPINIPISVGEMKSKLPILNIATLLLYCMPIFIVTWFGSLYITRYFELNALYANGNMLHSYPHILNIFTSVNLHPNFRNTGYIDIARIFCNAKLMSDVKFNAVLSTINRIFIITFFLSLMSVPLYWGVYSYISASKSPERLSSFLCLIGASINVLQMIGFIINEWRFRHCVYVRQGNETTIVNISNNG